MKYAVKTEMQIMHESRLMNRKMTNYQADHRKRIVLTNISRHVSHDDDNGTNTNGRHSKNSLALESTVLRIFYKKILAKILNKLRVTS